MKRFRIVVFLSSLSLSIFAQFPYGTTGLLHMPQIPAAYDNDEAIVKIKNNVEKMKATAVGQKFTDFEMQTPEGKTVKLSDYVGKGKVVLVDFWASWCGPCRREMPNLVEAYAKYKNKNFEIVGVSLDQSADAWKEAIKKLNITWPQMSDLKYWNCEGAQLYAVSSIPHTVLIDGEGTILARGLHGDELQEKIAEAVK
jgi:peroxiredoxin